MMWVGDYGSLFEKGCVLSYCKSLIVFKRINTGLHEEEKSSLGQTAY